jgi:hypothetical protein
MEKVGTLLESIGSGYGQGRADIGATIAAGAPLPSDALGELVAVALAGLLISSVGPVLAPLR